MLKISNNTPLPKIGAPATRALNNIGVNFLEQLVNYTEQEISELHGVGPKAVRILKEAMLKIGISFK